MGRWIPERKVRIFGPITARHAEYLIERERRKRTPYLLVGLVLGGLIGYSFGVDTREAQP